MELFATCQNNAANFADIFTNGDIQKRKDGIEENKTTGKSMSTNKTFCTNDGNNDFFIQSSGLGNIEVHDKQKINQFNHCFGQLGMPVPGPAVV